MSITIRDIAKVANVSRGTVDRVLHNRSGVKPEVEAKIRKLLEQMDFVPNMAGKILAARKQHISFACLLPDKENPFFADVIKGIRNAEKELSDYGVTIEIEHVKGYESNVHIKAIEKLAQGAFSGLCLTTLDIPEVQLEVHKIIEKGTPVVSLNTDIPDSGRVCYVGTNYFRAGKTAAGMLSLVTHNPLCVLVITGSYNIRGHKERINGFLDGLKARNIDFSVTNTVESFDSDEVAYERAKTELNNNPKINCVFVAAAGIGGVCKAVQEKINERTENDTLSNTNNQIKIVAFDENESIKAYMARGLIDFTICQDPEMQGYMGIKQLFSWLMVEGKRKIDDYITPTTIKIRENAEI